MICEANQGAEECQWGYGHLSNVTGTTAIIAHDIRVCVGYSVRNSDTFLHKYHQEKSASAALDLFLAVAGEREAWHNTSY